MPLGWLIFRTPRLNSQEVNWPKIETAWTPFALPVSGNKTPRLAKPMKRGFISRVRSVAPIIYRPTIPTAWKAEAEKEMSVCRYDDYLTCGLGACGGRSSHPSNALLSRQAELRLDLGYEYDGFEF